MKGIRLIIIIVLMLSLVNSSIYADDGVKEDTNILEDKTTEKKEVIQKEELILKEDTVEERQKRKKEGTVEELSFSERFVQAIMQLLFPEKEQEIQYGDPDEAFENLKKKVEENMKMIEEAR